MKFLCYSLVHSHLHSNSWVILWAPSRVGGKQQGAPVNYSALQPTLHSQDVWKSITNLYMALLAGVISSHSNAAGVYKEWVWDLAQVRDTGMETPAGECKEGTEGPWAESPTRLAHYRSHCGHQPRNYSMSRVVAPPVHCPTTQIGLKKYRSHCQAGKSFLFWGGGTSK